MTGGFTFDGIDINDIGLTYAPDLNNTYVYQPTTYKNHEQIFEAHDGGYYYGSSAQPKDFVLRCIYEDQHVLGGVITKIHDLFRHGRTGRLVFQKRPWCWYTATVTNVDMKQMTNYQNGVVTITLRAYYPFARTDYTDIPTGCEYMDDMLNNSALMNEWEFTNATSFSNVTGAKEILIHNPGTARAKVAIRIAGDVGGGITIANDTTEQSCRLVGITSELCANNYYVQCDGLNGQTVLTNGTNTKPAYYYHDYGFIELEPGYPAYRNIDVTATGNRNITSDGKFTADMVGRYIYFSNGAYAEIMRVDDDSHIQVGAIKNGSLASGKANIMKMNKIMVTPDDNINLTKLEFVFKPTFA